MIRKLLNAGLLLLTAMIWGFAFVAQKFGAEYLGAFSFNGIRFALGALSLIPVIFVIDKINKKRSCPDIVKNGQADKKKYQTLGEMILPCIIGGTILFAGAALQQKGIEITGNAGKAGFITALYTVLVPVIAFVIYKKRTPLITWSGVTLAIAGVFLLSINNEFIIEIGDLVLLLGTLFWAAHIIAVDRFVGEGIDPIKFSAGQFAVCAVLNLVVAFIVEQPTLADVWSAAVPLMYGGFMSVGIAYTLQVVGQKNVDPTIASIILSTESLFSAIGGMIFGETMSTRGYIGCLLMLGGIVLSQLKTPEDRAA